MFSSFEPDHPTRINRDISDAQKTAVLHIGTFFCKDSCGYDIVAQIAQGKLTVDE